jgi:hypothetical protein
MEEHEEDVQNDTQIKVVNYWEKSLVRIVSLSLYF